MHGFSFSRRNFNLTFKYFCQTNTLKTGIQNSLTAKSIKMEETNNSAPSDNTTVIPQLTSESIAYLHKAAKWGKFISLLGFIMTSLMIVAGILMSFVLNSVHINEMAPLNSPFSAKILSIFYVSVAAIFLIPVSFLHAFSNNAIKAVNQGNTDKMTTSLRNLKNLFVFLGISTLVILALYVIILLTIGTAAILNF